MSLGGIIGLTTVAFTVLLSQTRIFYAMAHDGLLPPFFAKLHSRTRTPWISAIISGMYCFILCRDSTMTLIVGGFCAVISGIFPIDIVGDTTSLTSLITYLFVHIDVIVVS
jgi:APA family basic amino acid/polyamine antiporter